MESWRIRANAGPTHAHNGAGDAFYTDKTPPGDVSKPGVGLYRVSGMPRRLSLSDESMLSLSDIDLGSFGRPLKGRRDDTPKHPLDLGLPPSTPSSTSLNADHDHCFVLMQGRRDDTPKHPLDLGLPPSTPSSSSLNADHDHCCVLMQGRRDDTSKHPLDLGLPPSTPSSTSLNADHDHCFVLMQGRRDDTPKHPLDLGLPPSTLSSANLNADHDHCCVLMQGRRDDTPKHPLDLGLPPSTPSSTSLNADHDHCFVLMQGRRDDTPKHPLDLGLPPSTPSSANLNADHDHCCVLMQGRRDDTPKHPLDLGLPPSTPSSANLNADHDHCCVLMQGRRDDTPKHPLDLGLPPSTPSSSSLNTTMTNSDPSPGRSEGCPMRPKLPDVYSKKVFVGGLPPDIDADRIMKSFRPYGSLQVTWPHKVESQTIYPPKGFAFLQFQEEESVHRLLNGCLLDGNGYYTLVSSPTVQNKPVQIRPWRLQDADYYYESNHPKNMRNAVFVGGVPRPLKASQLGMLMSNLYGEVVYAGIDIDTDMCYPKGAGMVVFGTKASCIAAISARFVQIDLEDINKRVEVKSYILQDQMCDNCAGQMCGDQLAPYFCGSVACLKYLCLRCWGDLHSRPGFSYHKPLLQKCSFDHVNRSRSTHGSWL